MRAASTRLRYVLLIALTSTVASCAHSGHDALGVAAPPVAPPRVLVLAPQVETPIEGVSSEILGVAFGDGLASDGGLEVVYPSADASASVEADCAARLACLREIGAASDADFVATATIVALGDTAMLRVRFVDVADAGGEQVRQAVVEPADQDALSAALRDVGVVFARPFVPESVAEPSAARRRWRWLAPTLAAVVIGGVAATVVLTRPGRPPPDVVIVPP